MTKRARREGRSRTGVLGVLGAVTVVAALAGGAFLLLAEPPRHGAAEDADLDGAHGPAGDVAVELRGTLVDDPEAPDLDPSMFEPNNTRSGPMHAGLRPGVVQADVPGAAPRGTGHDPVERVVVTHDDPGLWDLVPTAVLGLGLPEPRPVTGRVVDEDGLPLVDVEVRVMPDEDLMFDIEIPTLTGHWLGRTLFPSVRTDAQGRFRAAVPRQWDDDGVAFGPRLALLAVDPHDGREQRLVTAAPDEDGTRYDAGTVTLRPAARIVGRIVDEHGEPRPGLHLCVDDWWFEDEDEDDAEEEDEDDPWDDGELDEDDFFAWDFPDDETGARSAMAFAELGLELFCATTGADGRFAIDGIPAGDFNFEVRRPLGEDSDLEDVQPVTGSTLDLGVHVVEPGMRLAGRVRGEDGRPLAHATVVVVDEDTWFSEGRLPDDLPWLLDELPLHLGAIHTATDAAGRFELTGIQSEDCVVMAWAPGHRPDGWPAFEEEDVEALDLLLAPTPRLLLEVVDATQERLGDLVVAATGHPDHGEEYARLLPVSTGAVAATRAGLPASGLGLALVEDLSRETTWIGVAAPGYGLREIVWPAGPEAEPGGTRRTDRLTVELNPASSVQGTVYWSDAGAVAQGAVVRLHGPHRWIDIEPQVTGPDGRFRFDGLGADRWRLWARVSGWDQRAVEEFPLDAAQDLVLDLVLGGDTSLHGRVIDATGRALEGVPVSTRLEAPEDRDAGRRTMTDADGRYRFDGLHAGERWVVALGGRETIELAPRSMGALDLDAGRVATVYGTMWLGGAAVAGTVTLEADAKTVRSRRSEQRTIDGAYVFHRLDEGVMTLRGTSMGGAARAEQVLLAVAGAETHADLELELGRGTLQGRLTDAVDGSPLADARLTLHQDPGPMRTTFTDREGRYRFDHLQELPVVSLHVRVEGRVATFGVPTPITGTVTRDFELLPVGSLSGTVDVGPDHADVRGLRVRAVPIDLGRHGVSATSAPVHEGRFRFDALAVGRWRIMPPGGGPGDGVHVTIAADGEAVVDLVTP